jgi:hypothetical protein
MNQMDAWETHLQHQEERQSLRHPGHHPVNVGHLVMGVAFLGLFVVWLLVTTGTVVLGENRWLLPAPWIAAGVAGLVASALKKPHRS